MTGLGNLTGQADHGGPDLNLFLGSVFGTVFVADLGNDYAAHDIALANLLLASTEYEADKDEVIDRDSWKRVRYKFKLVW